MIQRVVRVEEGWLGVHHPLERLDHVRERLRRCPAARAGRHVNLSHEFGVDQVEADVQLPRRDGRVDVGVIHDGVAVSEGGVEGVIGGKLDLEDELSAFVRRPVHALDGEPEVVDRATCLPGFDRDECVVFERIDTFRKIRVFSHDGFTEKCICIVIYR